MFMNFIHTLLYSAKHSTNMTKVHLFPELIHIATIAWVASEKKKSCMCAYMTYVTMLL